MKAQDLADIFGVDAALLGEAGVSTYSELRALALQESRRQAIAREAIEHFMRPVVSAFIGALLERVIAHLILEVESDQDIKGFDTAGYL